MTGEGFKRVSQWRSAVWLRVFQLKSYPSEISLIARNDPTSHVERSEAESKQLTQWSDNDFLALL